MVSCVFAQLIPYDNPRTNMQTGFRGDSTGWNSQYVYIRVTLAGVMFELSNGDWVIGDTAGAGGSWYAYLGNEYHNAGGRWAGALPPSFINPATAPYNTVFNNDMPIIWNKGGVALDFMLAVVNMAGWSYESQHSSNRLADDAITSHEAFQNGMQVRAVFVRWGQNAVTSHYNDLSYMGAGGTDPRFKFANRNSDPWPGTADHNWVGLLNADVVYTTDMIGGMAAFTSTWDVQTATDTRSWFEATSNRFNPNKTVTDSMDLAIGASAFGLGLAPDRRITIALELLTPRKVTREYAANGFLQAQKVLKLRVWGTPSDASE